MTGLADAFPRASFFGVEFPYTDRSIHCSLRHHTHEYPHSPGGDDEDLGRRLYEFGFTCDFDTAFNEAYPRLYPEALLELVEVFNQGIVGRLVVPGFGTFLARCVDWDLRKMSRITSGEKVNFKFIEIFDNNFVEQDFATTAPLAIPQFMTVLREQVTQLEAAPLGALPANARPKLQDLSTLETTTSQLAAATNGDVGLVTQRARAVLTACQQYDALTFLRYARAYPAMDALHELFKATLGIYKDALRRGRRIDVFVNDEARSVPQIATKIYGSTKNTIELMRLNTFADALLVPSGTQVRYYSEAA